MERIEGTGLDERYNFKVVRRGRKSGVLCHVTSLPSPYGIGTLGQASRDFIDYLLLSGQSVWQILPLGVTGFGNSPYQSFSNKAGNPYLIDLDGLIEEGLLARDLLSAFDFGGDPQRVDYGLLWKNRRRLLRLAFDAFISDGHDGLQEAFNHFKASEDASWLHAYALFMTIKSSEGARPFWLWPDPLKLRDEDSLEAFSQAHWEDLEFEKFLQFFFFRQWGQVRDYASRAGIEIIGDIPIYVAEDSVEVWQEPHLFQLDEDLRPVFVAGCPPDYFSDTGQLWGNPLYDWPAHEEEGFRWWIDRLSFQMRLYDTIRIDHFRGLESYWSIPYGEETARRGHWIPGPADRLFEAARAALGPLSIIAEDLGYMTEEVYQFRERTGFPGMKILQFAFNPDAKSDYLPHNLTDHAVLYTGTHDNDTIAAWFELASPEEVEFAVRYLGLSPAEGYVDGMMRAAATTVCDTVIYQVQDLLGLGDESRMNRPGTLEGNWEWRMLPGALTPLLAARMRELARMSGRLPD